MKQIIVIVLIVIIITLGFIFMPNTRVVEIVWDKEMFDTRVNIIKERMINDDVTNFTLVWQELGVENTGDYGTTTLKDKEMIAITGYKDGKLVMFEIGLLEIYKKYSLNPEWYR